MFDTLEMSLTGLEQLAPVETKIRQRRKSLADEIGCAAESVALNVSEARQRAGLDRADLFRRAAGSVSEFTTALRIARARGYITGRSRCGRRRAGSGSRNAVAAHPLSTAAGLPRAPSRGGRSRGIDKRQRRPPKLRFPRQQSRGR